MNLQILDDFYEQKDFAFMMTAANINSYYTTYQPNNRYFTSRSNAYPCHQTKEFKSGEPTGDIFVKTFEEKTKLKIKNVSTYFRKIYSKELKNVFKYGIAPHIDPKIFNVAGVIHFNTFGLDDGTGLISNNEEPYIQIEPDIIIGAKPNRCVFYDSQIYHKPLQDPNTEIRIIQPFFITFY